MMKQLFINLPVKNLDKTIKFFTKIGFMFNPKFTDKNATCMIIGKNMFAMLLVEKFFQSFTKKEICNAKKSTEIITSIAVSNKKEVDSMMDKVLRAGGIEAREAFDHGWMYGRSFQDIDGHLWEIFYMDEKSMPQQS